MPIYQRPTNNIGVTRTFSGTITDSGSTPIEGAVVALKRKGGGIVAFADTDASGNYNFDINADGEFQLVYSLSKDPSALTTSDELSPANPYSWYSGGGYVDYLQQNCIVRLGSSSLYYPNGGGIVWTSMPSYRVIDTAGYTPTDPFSGGVVIGSYTETGIGEGAEVELGFANPGDYVLTLNGNPREYTAEEKNFGSIINKVTVKSIGRAYQTPILWISGTSINHRTKSGDPLEGEYARTVNGQEYWAKESSTTIAYSLTIFNIPSYVSAYPSDYSSRIREYYLNSINGYGEGYTYGAWTGNNVSGQYVQGTRFTAALPGEQDKSNFDNTAVDNSVFLNGITNTGIMKKHGMQFYYTLIYGPGGSPGNFTEPGLAWLADRGRISPQELDIIKGYVGTHFYVSDLLTGVGINPLPSALQTYSNIGNFFYQMTQAVETTVNNAGNGAIQWSATHPDAISNNSFVGYLQYYSLTFKDLCVNLANEFRSFSRQKKGVDIPTSNYSSVIYPILQKAGISTIQTVDGNTTRNWSITPSNINYQ